MKILMINHEFFPLGGGGSTVTYYIAKELSKLGCEVHLVTSTYKGLKRREKIDNIYIHRVLALRKRTDFSSTFEMLTFIISSSFYCLRLTRKLNPNVIQAYFGVPAGPVAYLTSVFYKIPYIIYLGGADVPGGDVKRFGLHYRLLSPVIKKVWRGAQKVIAASTGLKERALKTDKSAEIMVIPNGVDLEKFKPNREKIFNKKIEIILIGRLIPRKGFQFLLQSLPKILKEAKRDFEVTIVGGGPFQEDLEKMVNDLGVNEIVNFVGAVPYDKLIGKYQSADIFALPSVSEGMPCVMLEAMACGLPVVASRVEGNDELVKNDVNGYLVSSRDPDALAEALIVVINDDEKRELMGKKSEKIIKDFGWSNIARQYLDIYEKSRESEIEYK